MDSSTPSSSPAGSKPDFITKFTWHSKELAQVEPRVFKICKNDFGIPKGHYSTPLKDSHDVPISNSIFLPPPGARLEDYHWDITGESRPPPLPDHRELWVHVTKSDALGLVNARTPLELCVAIGHGMLGWMSMLHRGFLHRDVGIPAVFLLPDPVEMTPFVPGRFEHVLQEAQVDETLQDQVGRLRKAMADLDIAGSCRGVIQPSDMAVEMKDYYTSCKNAHQPDYYEFMSSGLLRSIRLSETYLHSPVDDLESFYYTMQWAAVHNEGSSTGKHETKELEILRAGIFGSADSRFQGTLLVHRIRPNNQEDAQKFGAFLPKLQPVFKKWYPSILALVESWRAVKDGFDGTDVSRQYIRHALVFAYRGVADYLEIVHKHRKSLG